MYVHVLILAKFNVQREITPKVGKPELRFMCSASSLKLLYICVKFRENIERTQVHSRNGYFQYLLCSRAETPKVGSPELCCFFCFCFFFVVFFFCVLYIVSWCFTFVWNFIIISRMIFNLQSLHKYMAEMATFNVQRAITSKVGRPVVCTSSHNALHFCEVSWISSTVSELWSGHEWWKCWQIDRHSKFWRVYHNTFATFCGRA